MIAVGLAAVAVAALVDGLRGGRAASTPPASNAIEGLDLTGADAPRAGQLPGQLVFADNDCRLGTLSLARLELGRPGIDTGCDVWAAPTGERAVTAMPGPEAAGTGLRPLGLVDLAAPSEIERELGEAVGPVAWAPDGGSVAYCAGAEGQVSIATLDLGSGDTASVAGCYPRFAPDGTLLRRPAADLLAEVWDGSGVVLTSDDLLEGFPRGPRSTLHVLDYDRNVTGTLVVTVRRSGPDRGDAIVELWEDGRLTAAADLPTTISPDGSRFGELVRFSPDGSQVAVGSQPGRAGGPVIFVDLRLRRPTLRFDRQTGYAWSPDGAWLAVAQNDEILFYARESDEVVYRLPLQVTGLNWVEARPG